jgi:hypothetical protein
VYLQLGRVLHVLWRLVRERGIPTVRRPTLPAVADLRSNYLADAYETYSSSAQAAQSFARNIFSGVFPLFAHQMVNPHPRRLLPAPALADPQQYIAMGYPQASTLVASVALALAVAPILLIRYGKTLRARSKVASALAEMSR